MSHNRENCDNERKFTKGEGRKPCEKERKRCEKERKHCEKERKRYSGSRKLSKKERFIKELEERKCEQRKLGHVYSIYASDFDHGTYIIEEPGIYNIKEDIVFHPNEDQDFRPVGPKYDNPAFSLGFFAVITIQTENVFLNLGGHSISQSEVFALQQRFLAIIEMASAPFIPPQGPSDFGPVVSASWCMIYNGTLGRSAHHGIHGNGPHHCLIKDLIIKDFEIAGVAINGGETICLEHIKIGPNFKDVKIVGTYSAARFIPQFYETAIACANSMWKPILEDALANLNEGANQVLHDVENGKKPTHPVYANPSGLPDGNNYGVLFHPIGVAINDFITEDFDGKLSKNIYIDCVKVFDMKVKVKEIVAISGVDGTGVQRGPSGSVFHMVIFSDKDGRYIPNSLAEAQLTLAKFGLTFNKQFGRLGITHDVIEWAEKGYDLNWLLEKGYVLKCAGDSMHHIAKPIHGFRFDGIKGLHVNRTGCSDISNVGKMGDEESCGFYEKSHDAMIRKGYGGTDTSGWSFSKVIDAEVCNSWSRNLFAENGDCRGYRFINGCEDFNLYKYCAKNVKCGKRYEDGQWFGTSSNCGEVVYSASYPNTVPVAMGINIEDEDCDISLGEGDIKHVSGPICASILIKNE